MKKKIFSLILLVSAFSMTLFGCEKSTQLRTAYINEITAAGSENYAIKVSYSEDSRLENKGTDIQVKFDNIGTIKIGKENEEKFQYKINDYDEWYSMTAIFAQAENKVGEEKFENYKDALPKTYLFEFDGDIKITFRIVAGDIEENSEGTGEILAGSEPISEQFTLKINKNRKNSQ